MFCEFVSDEPYTNLFVSDILKEMGRSYICGYCIGHTFVVACIN